MWWNQYGIRLYTFVSPASTKDRRSPTSALFSVRSLNSSSVVNVSSTGHQHSSTICRPFVGIEQLWDSSATAERRSDLQTCCLFHSTGCMWCPHRSLQLYFECIHDLEAPCSVTETDAKVLRFRDSPHSNLYIYICFIYSLYMFIFYNIIYASWTFQVCIESIGMPIVFNSKKEAVTAASITCGKLGT